MTEEQRNKELQAARRIAQALTDQAVRLTAEIATIQYTQSVTTAVVDSERLAAKLAGLRETLGKLQEDITAHETEERGEIWES